MTSKTSLDGFAEDLRQSLPTAGNENIPMIIQSSISGEALTDETTISKIRSKLDEVQKLFKDNLRYPLTKENIEELSKGKEELKDLLDLPETRSNKEVKDIVDKFLGEIYQITNTLKSFGLPRSTPSKMEWIKPPATKVTHYPGEFKFDAGRQAKPVITENIMLGKVTLKHATSPEKLVHILTDSEQPTLAVNNQNDSNICDSGVLFCGIDLNFQNRSLIPDAAKRNRYGACVIKFQLPATYLCDERKESRCFILGTKFYRQEYCQAILVDNRTPHNDKWCVVDESQEFNCREIEKPEEYLWTLKYEEQEPGTYPTNYTNPDLVFTNNIHLLECTNLSIEFDGDHNCELSRRGKCSICCWINLEYVRVLCILENGGRKILRFPKPESKLQLAIFVFAMSTSNVRSKILDIQIRNPTLFSEKDFTDIQWYWDKYPHTHEIRGFQRGPSLPIDDVNYCPE